MPNREQRRKMAKTMNTPQKLERLVDELVKERTKEIKEDCNNRILNYIEVMIVMTAYTLKLEGYGKKRLPRIIERTLMNIDSFRTGELEPGDYDIIKKEIEDMGVKF